MAPQRRSSRALILQGEELATEEGGVAAVRLVRERRRLRNTATIRTQRSAS